MQMGTCGGCREAAPHPRAPRARAARAPRALRPRMGAPVSAAPDPKATGSSVECACCGRYKAPRGRSVPMEIEGSYCARECPGHDCAPLPGDLWPGETREEFGYPCATAGELDGQGKAYEPAAWTVARPSYDLIKLAAAVRRDGDKRQVRLSDLRAALDYIAALEGAIAKATAAWGRR